VGKSVLMDLFFESTADIMTHRRRVHFNAAMLELHSRMHTLQREAAAEAEATASAVGIKGTDEELIEGAGGGEEVSLFKRGPLAYARSVLLAVRRRTRQRNLAAARSPEGNHGNGDGAGGGPQSGKWQTANSRVLQIASREMLGDVAARDGGFALLCFDEFQVTDAFASVALKGVFEELLRAGAVVVATSNRSIAVGWETGPRGIPYYATCGPVYSSQYS